VTTLAVQCAFAYPGGFRLETAFETGPGITAVVGPSGGGKSTLLALIAGLLRPSEGVISFAGRTFSDSAAGLFLSSHRRRVGVAFQEGRLFPHRTVAANLRYGQRRFSATRPSFETVVEALELGELLQRRPTTLSGGQQQRVALGRAILTGAGLLLFDEPVSSLGEPLRDRVLDFLRESVAATGSTCLVVIHDPAAAIRLASTSTVTVQNGVARRSERPTNSDIV